MALNFPANPQIDDTYTSNGVTWEFDGTAWNIVSSGSGVGGISNVVEDTTPQLGGDLDMNGNSIVDSTTANGGSIQFVDVPLNGTGLHLLPGGGSAGGVSIIPASGGDYGLRVEDGANNEIIMTYANAVYIQSLLYPMSDGTAGQVITTDGSGTLSFADASGGGATNFNSLTDASTASLDVGKIYEPAIAMLRVDNIGTSAYTINSHYSGNNPTIYAISGTTLAFDLDNISGHPFELQDNTLTALTSNLVHVSSTGVVSTDSAAQGKSSGTLYWRIPESTPGTFVYQCQAHASMFGNIVVKDLSNL